MKSLMGKFYSGTSGLKLPFPKHAFPENLKDKSRLGYYALHNNSLEVNSSFYKIPLPSTILKWADEAPPDFRFTFKLFKGITHNKGLTFNLSDVEKFLQVIENAGKKNGCLLIQFPPSLSSAATDGLSLLLDAIHDIDQNENWKIAVEFRNKTWYNAKTYQLLQQHKTTLVIQDIPASATPFIETDLDFVYIRFHGPKGDYRGSYDDAFLAEYAGYINEWLDEGKTVYAYFNNTIGDALNDLETLRRLVSPDR